VVEDHGAFEEVELAKGERSRSEELRVQAGRERVRDLAVSVLGFSLLIAMSAPLAVLAVGWLFR
jgi:hypothetical protein